MEDRPADVVFLILLLSRRLRGRIWFHNEIDVFSTVFICLLVCSGLLASKAHQNFFFLIVSCLNVQRSAIVFYLKKIILLSEYVKACFLLLYQKYWIPNAASS